MNGDQLQRLGFRGQKRRLWVGMLGQCLANSTFIAVIRSQRLVLPHFEVSNVTAISMSLLVASSVGKHFPVGA